ncbi:MAG TPA: hypothetical protein VLL98_01020 [Rickettsiales bacterium]|nr:hypothetical protein [Rickettsiales bacterium]
MSSVMLINLIVFYSFLIIILSFALFLFAKARKNKIHVVQNSNPIFKILECYSINIDEFVDFIDYLVRNLSEDYKSLEKEALRYDLLNYFVLFLNGKTISETQLDKYFKKHKGGLPLLYIIEKNFVLDKNNSTQENILYNLITNQFNHFLNFSSQKELGVQFFEWVAAGRDNNICEYCKSLDGKIFSWAEGNNGKYPSQNKCSGVGFCRCTAKAVDVNNKSVKIVRNEDGSYSIT